MINVARELDPLTYAKVVAFVWYHYDCLLMLGEEVEYIWGHGLTWTVLVFILVRLIAMAELWLGVGLLLVTHDKVSRKTCRLLGVYTTGSVILLFLLVSVILQTRLYVMYNRRRWIAWLNGALCALTAFISVIWVLVFIPLNKASSVPIEISRPPESVPCYGRADPLFTLCLLPPLLYVAYLAGMASWRVGRHVTMHREADNLSNAHGLLRLLAWSNMAYLAAIFSAVLVVITLWLTKPVAPLATSLQPLPATIAVGSTRLIISLRKELLAPPGLVTTFSADHGADVAGNETRARLSSATHIVALPADSNDRNSRYTEADTSGAWELVEMGGRRRQSGPDAQIGRCDEGGDVTDSAVAKGKGKARLSAEYDPER